MAKADLAPLRSVVALPTRGDGPPGESTLLEGHDFYGAPRVDAAGERLAVVAWEHPDMPWDASLARRGAAQPSRRPGACAPAGGGAPMARRGRPRRVGRTAGMAARRHAALRLRPPGVVAALRPPGAARRGGRGGRAAADGRAGRVPRAGLGARPARPWPSWPTAPSSARDDCVRARRRRPPAARRAAVDGAVPADPVPLDQPCVSIAALCAHGEGLALIGSTPDAPVNVWVWMPEAVRAAGRCARSARRRGLRSGAARSRTRRAVHR